MVGMSARLPSTVPAKDRISGISPEYPLLRMKIVGMHAAVF
jgi:hypothetical protein